MAPDLSSVSVKRKKAQWLQHDKQRREVLRVGYVRLPMMRVANFSIVVVVGIGLVACGGRRGTGGRSGNPDASPDAVVTGNCGNGMRDGTELCDGPDLGENSCESLNFTGGTLACAASCDGFDFSMCEGEPGTCNNGMVEAGERCDGSNVGDASCESLGQMPGQLRCTADCLNYDTSLCGTASMNSPQILSFNSNVSSITNRESVVISIVATDPDGIDDIIGGTLNDPTSGSSYGALVAEGNGSFSLTVSWSDMDRVRPIEFMGTGSRELQAEIFDVAGNRALDSIQITLTCSTSAACAGSCVSLDRESNCGACGNQCMDGTECAANGGSFSCQCPEFTDRCPGSTQCEFLESEENCGACGNTCPMGSFCGFDGAAFACECSGLTEQLCPAGCVEIDDPMNCGGCGIVCNVGDACIDQGGGIFACVTGYDQTLPSQSISTLGNTFIFTGVPSVGFGTPATISITASGDFDQSGETASIRIDGVSAGTYSPSSCGTATRTFPVADVSSAAADGVVEITFSPSTSVNLGVCGTDTVSAQLTI